VGPLTEQDARSAWMIYFNSPDIEATTRQVEDSGGTVRVAPMDVPGQARMAQFTDPQGGEFAAWQPSPNKGLESVDEPGSLTWTELYTPDADAAKAFYGRLFDWRTDDTELPGGAGTYAIISPTSGGEDRMQGGMMQVGPDVLSVAGGHAYWHPVFGTTDCDATAAAVTTNGGGVHMGPQDVEGVGRLAVCVDPFGADFVALQPERG
jgi:predicted enzyme related to lactoylglutathione lyase